MRFVLLMVGPWVVLWLLLMGSIPVDPTPALIALGMITVPTALVGLTSSTAGAAEWAFGRGARFAPEWNEVLWHHLIRTRVARTLGVMLGLATSMMLTGVYNAGGGATLRWWPEQTATVGIWVPALGYVVGSVWAEARKPRRRCQHGAGTALLTPRRLGDYLDPNVAWSLGAFGMYAVTVVAVWAVVPLPTASFPADATWFGVVMPMAVLLLALGGAVWVSRRRERAADDMSLAYEELTRTATVNALVGASIAMFGEFALRVASLPRGGAQIAAWLQLFPMLIGWLGIGVWIGCGTNLVFRNRRIDALRAAA